MTPSDPVFIEDKSFDEYREVFRKIYCQEPVITFDGIQVSFKMSQFKHVFMESTKRNREKDLVSEDRLKRILWIKHILESSDCDLRFGYDRDTKQTRTDRRVSLYRNKYAVVIQMTGKAKAIFITAYYITDPLGTGIGILNSPKWKYR